MKWSLYCRGLKWSCLPCVVLHTRWPTFQWGDGKVLMAGDTHVLSHWGRGGKNGKCLKWIETSKNVNLFLVWYKYQRELIFIIGKGKYFWKTIELKSANFGISIGEGDNQQLFMEGVICSPVCAAAQNSQKFVSTTQVLPSVYRTAGSNNLGNVP